jgi:ubiquinone/menaquinone biosynthesis C-methylase UbiE
VFDNTSVHSGTQHRLLAESLDSITTTRLTATGVGDGWDCLEVGAGGGSVALWLADRVAPSGSVLATDIEPVELPARPGLEVTRHDIVCDPLAEGAFDLIHARLVLMHLPQRHAVLDRLRRALRPGGWLQLDEFDISYGPALLMPSKRARELYESFMAAKYRLFVAAGADVEWGASAAEAMRDAGLVDVDPVPFIRQWRAGSAGVELLIHHTFHLHDQLVAAGITDAQLSELRDLLVDPGFRATSCVIYSVQGRRPRSTGPAQG